MDRIDTHLHLIYPEKFSYAWTAGLPALAGQAFRLDDYAAVTAASGVSGAIFMEVDVPEAEMADEAAFFCRMAENPENRLLGVIAACRPENPDMAGYLAATAHPFLRGYRRVLHVVDDAVSTGARFRENVAMIGQAGLTFDICMLARQLPLAMDLVDACPGTTMILDHCGVPDLSGDLAGWKNDIAALASRPNLNAKISGIIAYAAPEQMSVDLLRPVVEHVIDCFGWDRVVWGSDWPVCNLTHGAATWCAWTDALVAGCSDEEKSRLFSGNARRIYRLPGA